MLKLNGSLGRLTEYQSRVKMSLLFSHRTQQVKLQNYDLTKKLNDSKYKQEV